MFTMHQGFARARGQLAWLHRGQRGQQRRGREGQLLDGEARILRCDWWMLSILSSDWWML